MRSYLTRDVSGNLIFDALATNPGGLTMDDLIELTEMTANQIRYGMTYVREVLASENGEPIVYQPNSKLYKLATTVFESKEDLARRCATWKTQVMRARMAVADPSIQKFGIKVARLEHLQEDFRRVETDLTSLLNDLGA